jgi:hypothetical protein
MSECWLAWCVRSDGHAGKHRPTRFRIRSVVCVGCQQPFQSRHPRTVRCPGCKQDERNRYMRAYMRRRRQRIVLGPLPCQGCRAMVTWSGTAWQDPTADDHSCAAVAAA